MSHANGHRAAAYELLATHADYDKERHEDDYEIEHEHDYKHGFLHGDEASSLSDRRTLSSGERSTKGTTILNAFKNIVVVLGLLSGACSIYHYRTHVMNSGVAILDDQIPGPSQPLVMCESLTHHPVKAPKKNIWKNLDVAEARSVREWLFEPQRGLNLTRTVNSTSPTDNTVFLVEAWRPPKKAALDYLSGNALTEPDRYARAIISHAGENPAVIRDYLIGPLPISKHTSMRPLKEIYTNPDIPYNARIFSMSDFGNIQKFFAETMGSIAEVTIDLLGASARGLPNDTLIAGGQAPMSYDGSWRRMWVPMKLKTPGFYLHSLDLQLFVDMTSPTSSDWKILKVWYNSQLFDSIDSFVSAWEKGTIVRGPKTNVTDVEWSTRVVHGAQRDLDDRAGPRSVMFDGPRFRYDEKEAYLTWMDFSMYFGFERDMGLSFNNIAYRGERIIYELMPQEALAQYSGEDPSQSSTVWQDRAFGMGQLARSLMVGYDCPVDALYISSTVHPSLGSVTQPNAICVFERDSGKPLSRHWATDRNEAGATKGYELVVRQVSTIGNYDYLFDYTFQLDGTIEVRFSASGYIQGGFYDGNPARRDVGEVVRQTAMGALHDHVINYKIDFDIAGTKNSMHAMKLEVVEQERPWFEDTDWSVKDYTQKMIKHTLKTEDEGKLDYGTNAGGMYFITNEDVTNSWGTPRGYAIHPGVSNIHLTNLQSERTKHNVEWAKHALHVTRQKDTEPYSSNTFNINLPGKPPVDFGTFFDGESLEQEDLVVWANLGTHHIIRAEDTPHTSTNVATSYMLLTPFNWGDSDAGMASRNAVRVAPRMEESVADAFGSSGGWEAEGHIEHAYCVPPRVPKFVYEGQMILDGESGEDGPGGRLRTVEYRDLVMEAETIHHMKAEL